MNTVTHAPRRASPCESAHHWSAQAAGPVAADLTLTDRSLQTARWGCKGPAAPQWLAEHGLSVPPVYNRYLELATGGLVARLGVTEFLIEADAATLGLLQEAALPAGRVHGLYPVLRQDAALQLEGPALHTLLRQVCSVDLQARENPPDAVFLTTMVGVGVTLLWRGDAMLLWADGTMGSYLWDTLAEVARDCGSLRLCPAP
jgi:sarcosine oxidase subunit gamma